jgi:hypothetical protein
VGVAAPVIDLQVRRGPRARARGALGVVDVLVVRAVTEVVPHGVRVVRTVHADRISSTQKSLQSRGKRQHGQRLNNENNAKNVSGN